MDKQLAWSSIKRVKLAALQPIQAAGRKPRIPLVVAGLSCWETLLCYILRSCAGGTCANQAKPACAFSGLGGNSKLSKHQSELTESSPRARAAPHRQLPALKQLVSVLFGTPSALDRCLLSHLAPPALACRLPHLPRRPHPPKRLEQQTSIGGTQLSLPRRTA